MASASFGLVAHEFDQASVRVPQIAGVVVRVDMRGECRGTIESVARGLCHRIDPIDQCPARDAEREVDVRRRLARHDEKVQVTAVAVALGRAVDFPFVTERGEYVAVEAQVGVEVAATRLAVAVAL